MSLWKAVEVDKDVESSSHLGTLNACSSQFVVKDFRDSLKDEFLVLDVSSHFRGVIESSNSCELNGGRYSAKSFTLKHIHGADKLWHGLWDNHEANSPAACSQPLGAAVGDDGSLWVELRDRGVTFFGEACF